MNQSNIIMYTTEDGLTKIEVTFDEISKCTVYPCPLRSV